jgi:hypothetical protein
MGKPTPWRGFGLSPSHPDATEGVNEKIDVSGWAAPVREKPTWREWTRFQLDRILPRLGIPMGILVGGAITAGTTYALVIRVQNLIATAKITSDPNYWMEQARTNAYDACYFGCNDCDDTMYSWNGCLRTAQGNVTGIDCNAARMWNWKDRYPVECLASVGEIYKAEALEALKKSYRNQLAIIILTVLGGVVGGFLTYLLWTRVFAHRLDRVSGGRVTELPGWPRPFNSKPWKTTKRNGATTKKISFKAIVASGLALFGRGVKAYACTGYDASHNQYFVNANRTIYGAVHGWFSNCYDIEVCTQSCSTSCSGSGSGGTSCTTSCTPVCWTETYSDRAPVAFVNDVLPRVKACGFSLEDQVEGDVNVRIPNAGLERYWWLKISVNGFNITDKRDTDDSILCLHAIGDAK